MSTSFSLKYETNASSCPRQVPVVPMCLEYPDEAGEPKGYGSGPTPSTSATTAVTQSSGKKRGQHGRHKVHSKVHAIHKIGPHGEPLEPTSVIDVFSNQCAAIVKEHVPITYPDWRKIPADLKGAVWGEVKRRFEYPEDQFDEDVCRCHALFIAGKALRNLRSHLNKHYVKEGKTPYKDYNFIKRHVWEEFVEKMSTEESKSKIQHFFELAKRNALPHHLGMTGYAAKRKKWREEEREAAAAGQENPFEGINERGRDFFHARRPKKLKEGRTKYNEPQIEEAEKALLAANVAKERGMFEPSRQHDILGNPEHRGRVRGVSSRHSWKKVDSWQSDATSYHTRQRYKEGLIKKGRDEAVKEIVMGTIQEAFTSTDPNMVEPRRQMLLQAGVVPPQGQAAV
ncbi:hypothetical protein C2845_PM09G17090 [Panicum miliaceum]|uniref:Uncharacterized protein n=1 Tax=Panicum miliaceum TaxID=4540 RepID=A0A3L6RYD6_PANMI|nr:hypothetical protein C2845_PM09G17090 [Panicum miliaceum]